MAYWWVNQNRSYRPERAGEFLWAPKRNKRGGRVKHWETMLGVGTGDQIFHYVGEHVRAVSTAEAEATDAKRPHELPTALWPQEGRLLRASYRDVRPPLSRHDIPDEWKRRAGPSGPFQDNLDVKQGYLFPLEHDFGEWLLRAVHGRSIDGLGTGLPPEAKSDATDLLRRLIGIPLSTVAGYENVVLGVRPPNVIVRTTRSPDGRLVSISDVQAALNSLVAHGSVVIGPKTVGYRSAFIGAVLLTLPGTHADNESPPTITLLDEPPSNPLDDDPSDESDLPFEGDLTGLHTGTTRREQRELRRRLFGSSLEGLCAICGEEYPVRFLWAAHIKRRSVCTDPERRDLANVAMPACVFGCDALFELGYLSVSETGHIVTATFHRSEHPALQRRLKDLSGLACLAFSEARAAYFDWHRENVWRG